MLKLYGFPISNYFNMAKMALIEKGIDYEFVQVSPSQDQEFLAISPMGKIPCLGTDQGPLTETNVILEYIEETQGGPSFLPEDPYEKAKVRELMKEIELYIELPARTCYAQAFFGGEVSDETMSKARAALDKGIDCLKRNGKFSPYVAGENLTYADFVFMYSVSIANACAKRIWSIDLLEDFPAAKELLATLNQRDSAKQIAADQKT